MIRVSINDVQNRLCDSKSETIYRYTGARYLVYSIRLSIVVEHVIQRRNPWKTAETRLLNHNHATAADSWREKCERTPYIHVWCTHHLLNGEEEGRRGGQKKKKSLNLSNTRIMSKRHNMVHNSNAITPYHKCLIRNLIVRICFHILLVIYRFFLIIFFFRYTQKKNHS